MLKTSHCGSAEPRAARFACFAAIVFLVIFLCFTSCSLKRDVPADPKLVEAFRNADKIIEVAGAGGEGKQTFSGEAEAALDTLMKELANQKSKYTNPQQSADLQKLVRDVGELSVFASNLGWNPGGEQLKGFYEQWRAIRPRAAKFAGQDKEKK
jgi:hypothetical protein